MLTTSSTRRGPALRLYRVASDGARAIFSTATDLSIPLVAGVTVLCGERSEVDRLLALASQAELHVAVGNASVGPSRRWSLRIEDRRAA